MRRALAVAFVLAATGCGKENDLSGSVGELFSLGFNRVEVSQNSEALQVSYFNNRDQNVDLVIRFSVALTGLTLRNGERYPLEGEYAPGHLRTSVIHLGGGEPTRIMPPVSKGDFELNSGASLGEPIRGNFSMSFIQNGEYGSGRTLAGAFSSSLVRDAAFDPCPAPPCAPPMP